MSFFKDCHQLPSFALLNLFNGLKFLLIVILAFGKAQRCKKRNLDCRSGRGSGCCYVMFCQKSYYLKNRLLRFSKWLDILQIVCGIPRFSNSCTVNHQFPLIAVHSS